MTIPTQRLQEMLRLADRAVSCDPLGPGWYTVTDLAEHMEPVDAQLTQAANPAFLKALISEVLEQRGEG